MPNENQQGEISPENSLSYIITSKLNGKVLSAKRFQAGYSGYVYEVEAEIDSAPKKLVVKLNDNYKGNDSIDKDTVDDRIYAANFRSFEAVYGLLKENDIPTYELFTSGPPSSKTPFFYQAMSLLEGESIREYVTNPQGKDLVELHKIAGIEFAKLHNITRDFDGWVGQERPYSQDFRSAFLESLNHKLTDALNTQNQFLAVSKQKIEQFILTKANKISNPKEFVLSHIDGLQGLAKYEQSHWVFIGHIDLEDYCFTDQRFVLAGYETSVNFDEVKVPESFWDGYREHRTVDSTYEEVKGLFKLYYLLSWLPMVYEENWRGNPEDKVQVIDLFEKRIRDIINLH